MIESLSITDFALVDRLSIAFGKGLSVFTGETGAGKSILLKALGLLLGERADRDLVRTGAAGARVEGVFLLSGDSATQARAILDEAGIEWEEPLIIARSVSAEGGSRAFVNGASVGVGVLARLGAHLVEVSSQHQHQGLLEEKNHLNLLDSSLDALGRAALDAYRDAYGRWEAADRELKRLTQLESEGEERRDFLKFQLEELRAAALVEGEDDELKAEREVLANAEKIAGAYQSAYGELFEEGMTLDRLGRAARFVEKAAQNDRGADTVLELLREASASLEEASLALRERGDSIKIDPARLDVVDDRLELIRRLSRKHGPSVADILRKYEAMEKELWELENTGLALDEAQGAERKARSKATESGAKLSAARREAAAKLSSAVGQELGLLSIGTDAFIVEVTPGGLTPDGADEVRFMFAPNPGEEPKPLVSIASGGELSRVLLAVKNALRDRSVGTLVFDEVDSGVGGRTADRIGDRLAHLAKSCQVICVTHLPQIASRTAAHNRVEKVLEGGRTVTRVRSLSAEERVEELARMLGGGETPGAAWDHARELAAKGTGT